MQNIFAKEYIFEYAKADVNDVGYRCVCTQRVAKRCRFRFTKECLLIQRNIYIGYLLLQSALKNSLLQKNQTPLFFGVRSYEFPLEELRHRRRLFQ
jgi:hypothetical protein